MTGTVEVERPSGATGIALLILSRPEKANAYTQPMLAQMSRELATLAADPEVKVLVLTGAGAHFCAGADRDELDGRRGEDALDLESRKTFDQLARMPQPVIAAIRGAAVGGGFELALASDLRICAPDCRLALPETRLGLIPAAGAMRRLVPMVGVARTKELILGGRELDAETALAWGIVQSIANDTVAASLTLARSLQSRDAVAQRLAKVAIDALASGIDVALEAATQAFLYQRRAGR